MWLQSGIPAAVCKANPDVAKSGIYRQLNDGRYEFVSYCKPEIAHYLSILDTEYNQLLDANLPKQ